MSVDLILTVDPEAMQVRFTPPPTPEGCRVALHLKQILDNYDDLKAQVREWYPVTQAMPNPDVFVSVWTHDGWDIGYWDGEEWKNTCAQKLIGVICWQHAPAPPLPFLVQHLPENPK